MILVLSLQKELQQRIIYVLITSLKITQLFEIIIDCFHPSTPPLNLSRGHLCDNFNYLDHNGVFTRKGEMSLTNYNQCLNVHKLKIMCFSQRNPHSESIYFLFKSTSHNNSLTSLESTCQDRFLAPSLISYVTLGQLLIL